MDSRIEMHVVAAFAWVMAAHCAQAAMISVEPSVGGQPALVSVDGDLEPGDGDQFRSKTSFLSKAIVAFRSDGGSVVAGIQIGESIRLKGFTTAVTGTARCASACALAWLGGVRHLMSPEARIGFHAAYNREGQETGVGNALVGAYLNKIGLPYAAVIYITKAPPDSMTWLSVADAAKRAIEVEVSSSQTGASDPYPVPNGVHPHSSTMSPSPGPPAAPARREAEVSACVRIQNEEIDKAGQCIVDGTRRLIGNRTEGTAVLAEAIIGPCRAAFLYRMSQRSQSFQCDFLEKARDGYFALMRSHVIGTIVGLRTDLQNAR